MLARSCGKQSLRECRVIAHMPLWIALHSLLPELTQGWAPQANTKNFIDVPFGGFLGPPSEMVD
ncbi:hypothetical protein GCM10011391_15510 [Pullulanibacillus camelliae]|uniref:Uncharacterized protein n=1 Tax=Pullulanibacillus camelliae TaxID=1707096 RepID=A0A8J2VR71_9BACL|nr:hypothetical protein GCM10011391_15510 [Pullulanibacillus camelliae]